MSIFIIAKFEYVLLHTRIRPVVEEWPLGIKVVYFKEGVHCCCIISEPWIVPAILGSGASIIFPHLRCHLTLGVRHHFFDYLAFLISHIYLLDCNVDRLIFGIVTDTALLHHIDRDQSCICRLYLDVRTTARQGPRCLVGNRLVLCRGRIVACCGISIIAFHLQLLALRRITAICGERRMGIIEEFMEYVFFRLTAICKVTISVSILLEFMSFPWFFCRIWVCITIISTIIISPSSECHSDCLVTIIQCLTDRVLFIVFHPAWCVWIWLHYNLIGWEDTIWWLKGILVIDVTIILILVIDELCRYHSAAGYAMQSDVSVIVNGSHMRRRTRILEMITRTISGTLFSIDIQGLMWKWLVIRRIHHTNHIIILIHKLYLCEILVSGFHSDYVYVRWHSNAGFFRCCTTNLEQCSNTTLTWRRGIAWYSYIL